MKSRASQCATLIGDVVDSRGSADRRGLHRSLTTALESVAVSPLDPPRFTVGDEFQGTYPTVGAALSAAWLIRLAVAPAIDVRFGVGLGDVTVVDEASGIQDGPGWWAARAAPIEWTARSQRQPGLALVRTSYRSEAVGGAAAAPITPL